MDSKDVCSDGLTMLSKLLQVKLGAQALHYLGIVLEIMCHYYYRYPTINYLIILYINHFHLLCSVGRARDHQ